MMFYKVTVYQITDFIWL